MRNSFLVFPSYLEGNSYFFLRHNVHVYSADVPQTHHMPYQVIHGIDFNISLSSCMTVRCIINTYLLKEGPILLPFQIPHFSFFSCLNLSHGPANCQKAQMEYVCWCLGKSAHALIMYTALNSRRKWVGRFSIDTLLRRILQLGSWLFFFFFKQLPHLHPGIPINIICISNNFIARNTRVLVNLHAWVVWRSPNVNSHESEFMTRICSLCVRYPFAWESCR